MMTVYMTNGTLDYLTKLQNKYFTEAIFLMEEEDGGLAYYEGDKEIFDEPRTFDLVDGKGELNNQGYVVMNNIPVTDEGRPLFEDRFKNRAGTIENSPGFQALRILRPKHGNTYVVMTQWQNEESFENWKNSQAFQKAHQHSDSNKAKEKPSFAAGPAYITKYTMAQPE